MTKSEVNITKTCSSCGQQKPLSAFLQMTDQQAIAYGNICASCRKTNLTEIEEDDDLSRSTTQNTLDNKAKFQLDLNKELLRVKTEEEDKNENQLKEKEENEQTEKVEFNHSAEKKHRKTFLEKSSLLDGKAVQKASEQVFGGEQQKAKAASVIPAAGAPYIDTYFGEKLKHGLAFRQYKTWLGASAPLVKAAEQFKAAQKAPTRPADAPALTAADAAAKQSQQNKAGPLFSPAGQQAPSAAPAEKKSGYKKVR